MSSLSHSSTPSPSTSANTRPATPTTPAAALLNLTITSSCSPGCSFTNEEIKGIERILTHYLRNALAGVALADQQSLLKAEYEFIRKKLDTFPKVTEEDIYTLLSNLDAIHRNFCSVSLQKHVAIETRRIQQRADISSKFKYYKSQKNTEDAYSLSEFCEGLAKNKIDLVNQVSSRQSDLINIRLQFNRMLCQWYELDEMKFNNAIKKFPNFSVCNLQRSATNDMEEFNSLSKNKDDNESASPHTKPAQSKEEIISNEHKSNSTALVKNEIVDKSKGENNSSSHSSDVGEQNRKRKPEEIVQVAPVKPRRGRPPRSDSANQIKKGLIDSNRTINRNNDSHPLDVCYICSSGHKPDNILLCDGEGCTNEAHMSCLFPPMSQVPAGDWFCPECDPFGTTLELFEYLRSYTTGKTQTNLQARPMDSDNKQLKYRGTLGCLLRLDIPYAGNLYCSHIGRIVAYRGNDDIITEYLVMFKSGANNRNVPLITWLDPDDHICFVYTDIVNVHYSQQVLWTYSQEAKSDQIGLRVLASEKALLRIQSEFKISSSSTLVTHFFPVSCTLNIVPSELVEKINEILSSNPYSDEVDRISRVMAHNELEERQKIQTLCELFSRNATLYSHFLYGLLFEGSTNKILSSATRNNRRGDQIELSKPEESMREKHLSDLVNLVQGVVRGFIFNSDCTGLAPVSSALPHSALYSGSDEGEMLRQFIPTDSFTKSELAIESFDFLGEIEAVSNASSKEVIVVT